VKQSAVRPLVGLATIVVLVVIVALAVTQFRGGFSPTVPVTLLSERAGLVMNPDAKVQMRGVQVGKVSSIEELPDGRAAIHLAMDPSQLHLIPSNVLVDIAATTVFGAKFVQLLPPADPSPQPMGAGQVLDSRHVTVEINTVFEQLTKVLSRIQPDKLNETLGAIASALNGRGYKIGQMLADLDSFLAKVDPSLPALRHDLDIAPNVFGAYADVTTDLIKTADNTARISQTIVEEQHNLDAFLVSVIGLADIGNDVVGSNRQALTDVLHLLVPTTDLTSRYNEALYCGLAGLIPAIKTPPLNVPGIDISVGFLWGQERYRYPGDLPKVAAAGGPQCTGLPNLPYETTPPYVVTDTGTNPWKYGNPGVVLNSDLIKRILFGDLDGPPRNSAQIGQPG
jgi:virulence factor Mce-like protein